MPNETSKPDNSEGSMYDYAARSFSAVIPTMPTTRESGVACIAAAIDSGAAAAIGIRMPRDIFMIIAGDAYDAMTSLDPERP